jgi:hypothetical protein
MPASRELRSVGFARNLLARRRIAVLSPRGLNHPAAVQGQEAPDSVVAVLGVVELVAPDLAEVAWAARAALDLAEPD